MDIFPCWITRSVGGVNRNRLTSNSSIVSVCCVILIVFCLFSHGERFWVFLDCLELTEVKPGVDFVLGPELIGGRTGTDFDC